MGDRKGKEQNNGATETVREVDMKEGEVGLIVGI